MNFPINKRFAERQGHARRRANELHAMIQASRRFHHALRSYCAAVPLRVWLRIVVFFALLGLIVLWRETGRAEAIPYRGGHSRIILGRLVAPDLSYAFDG